MFSAEASRGYSMVKEHKAAKEWRDIIANNPSLREEQRAFHARFRGGSAALGTSVAAIFLGDSTMRNQFNALCHALPPGERAQAVLHLEAAYEIERQRAARGSDELQLATCTGRLGATRLRLAFVSRPFFEGAQRRLFARTVALLRWPRVDVVYFGSGLWVEWPVPFVIGAMRSFDWVTFGRWLLFEEELHAAVEQYAAMAPTARLLITNTHTVCEAAPELQPALREALAASTRARVLANCSAFLATQRRFARTECAAARLGTDDPRCRWLSGSLGTPPGLPALRPQPMCRAGLRTRNGSLALNARLERGLSRLPAELRRRVSLIDAFSLTDASCRAGEGAAGGDGLHFHWLLFRELELALTALGWRPAVALSDRDNHGRGRSELAQRCAHVND